MSYLRVKHLLRYVSVHIGKLILMVVTKTLQTEYTLTMLDQKDGYSTDIVRTKLTRDIAGITKEIHDELIMAVDELIPVKEHGA